MGKGGKALRYLSAKEDCGDEKEKVRKAKSGKTLGLIAIVISSGLFIINLIRILGEQ